MNIKKWIFILLLVALFFNQLAKAADDVVFKDTTGVEHHLSENKGKWILINYWATWCPPCLEEVPDLVNLYDQRKNKDLIVFGVVFDYESTKAVEQYVDDMLMSYPIVLGNDAITKQIGALDVLPTTFIYNPQGKLIKIKRGLISRQYIEKIIGKN